MNRLVRWINADLLPPDVGRERREDLYAELYPDGQLRHLGFYERGRCDAMWALHLEQGIPRGRAVLEKGSGGSADSEVYYNGTAERFDAWSDNSGPHKIRYSRWVKEWIHVIVQGGRKRMHERARGRR